MRTRIATMMAVILATPLMAADPPKKELTPNAALVYWQAFNFMPRLDADQEKLVGDWQTVPLNDAVEKLVVQSRLSVKYLKRAAKIHQCDWGLDYDDGYSLLLPHLQKARELSRLASLTARYDMERGNFKSGGDIAASLMVLGRHCGVDPIMISGLVSFVIQDQVIDLVAPFVPRIKADPKVIATVFAGLPAAATFSDMIRMEKQYMGPSMVRDLKEHAARPGSDWRKQWKQLFDGPNVSKEVKDIASLDEAIRRIQGLEPAYDELARLVALPRAEFDAKYPEFKAKWKASNPVAAELIPAMDKVMARQRRLEARTAMLMASFAVSQGGPKALESSKDPFGAGPFEYRALDQGFELQSKLQHEGKPVTLTVGAVKK